MITLSFGECLRQKREDTKGTTNHFTQPDVAKIMGLSQGTISNLEKGIKSPDSLYPKELLKLLRAYRFTDEEILEFASQFDLDVSLARLSNRVGAGLGEQLGKEAYSVRYFGTVNDYVKLSSTERRRHTDPQAHMMVPEMFMVGVDPEECFVVLATSDTYADDEGQRKAQVDAAVVFHQSLTPEPGDVVLCRVDTPVGVQGVIKAYLSPEAYSVVNPLGGDGRPIIIEEGDCGDICGVHLGSWIPGSRQQRQLQHRLQAHIRKGSSQKN